jgi:hypothetical protein
LPLAAQARASFRVETSTTAACNTQEDGHRDPFQTSLRGHGQRGHGKKQRGHGNDPAEGRNANSARNSPLLFVGRAASAFGAQVRRPVLTSKDRCHHHSVGHVQGQRTDGHDDHFDLPQFANKPEVMQLTEKLRAKLEKYPRLRFSSWR